MPDPTLYKVGVVAALAFPVAYVALEWTFSWMILGAVAAVGFYVFHTYFMFKEEERKEIPVVGPQAPLVPPYTDWEQAPDGSMQPRRGPNYSPPNYGGGLR